MVICESYMFGFSVSKKMNKKTNNDKTNMSSRISFNTNYQGIGN